MNKRLITAWIFQFLLFKHIRMALTAANRPRRGTVMRINMSLGRRISGSRRHLENLTMSITIAPIKLPADHILEYLE